MNKSEEVDEALKKLVLADEEMIDQLEGKASKKTAELVRELWEENIGQLPVGEPQ